MKYLELVEKFQEVQKQCAGLAIEYAQELTNGKYNDNQREWIEDVKLKLEEFSEY